MITALVFHGIFSIVSFLGVYLFYTYKDYKNLNLGLILGVILLLSAILNGFLSIYALHALLEPFFS